MNQRQAVTQVTEVAIWAREAAGDAEQQARHAGWHEEWTDLADAADDLAAMIERDTFRAGNG